MRKDAVAIPEIGQKAADAWNARFFARVDSNLPNTATRIRREMETRRQLNFEPLLQFRRSTWVPTEPLPLP